MRQVNLLCREKGEVVQMMERGRQEFLVGLNRRVTEAEEEAGKANEER